MTDYEARLATIDAAESPTVAEDYAALSREHLSPVLGRYFERSWARGEGHRLYDTAGKSYLDFACGIAVTALGHGHPAVNAAIHEQVDRLVHGGGGLGHYGPVSRLAAAIADTLPDPLDTVFFGNSGAEAVDGALKLVRRVTGRPGIVAFSGGFHGRTWGALSATSSNLNYRVGYEPLLPSVHIAPFPNVYRDFGGDETAATESAMHALARLLAEQVPATSVAALLIEPVQGEGGFNPAPPAFLRALRDLCDRHGILLIADEVQSGYGRTGLMWAFEHAGIVPDVVLLAKAIANGLPLAAIVTRRELQDRWGVGAHGSTYGGNPVACAAGIAVLETIQREGLVGNAATRGAELAAGLRALARSDVRIGDVRGPGMMVAVELVKDRVTREPDGDLANAVSARCADLGLLLLTCGSAHQAIRWIPPLDVTADEIHEGLSIFREALGAV
ncbi:MAG: aspartate aminotransferase family protein [Chloroflexi bacterium]|nr:aspartate aminotransferase family protein [Chloroflexota bacterium]